jgi:hypothetical protein
MPTSEETLELKEVAAQAALRHLDDYEITRRYRELRAYESTPTDNIVRAFVDEQLRRLRNEMQARLDERKSEMLFGSPGT